MPKKITKDGEEYYVPSGEVGFVPGNEPRFESWEEAKKLESLYKKIFEKIFEDRENYLAKLE